MSELYVDSIAMVASLLYCADVPFTLLPLFDGFQLRFPWHVGDVACHNGTYGADAGMVETYQFPWDDGDVSELKPIRAAKLIVDLYRSTR